MKPILIALLFVFLTDCSSVTQAPSGRTYQLGDNLPLTATNMKHGWVNAPESVTKSFQSDGDSIERGRVLYQHHCQQCHGPKGLGDGPLAKSLKIAPTDLTNLSSELPQSYLMVQINSGKGSMPKWESFLTPKQTWDVSQFVKSLTRKNQ